MIRSDPDFVKEQLGASEYAGTLTGVFIKAIIKALDEQEFEAIDDGDLEHWIADALHLFRGQPIVIVDDREWADFQLGDVSIRDTVRVRPDAYSGGAAKNHNGRAGRVLGTQGRKISVVYEDQSRLPLGPILHEHTALQKLVK